MQEAPVVSEGANQRITFLVTRMTTAASIPEWLHAVYILAADADSNVNTHLREIGGEAPSIEKVRMDLQGKLDVAKANRPEEGSEELEYWTDYVDTIEHQLGHIVEIWGSRVGYRAFVDKWDIMYAELVNIVNTTSQIIEGEMAQVFDARRKKKRDVTVPCEPAMRDLMMQVMGIRDFGQENITSHIEITRGMGELARRMFMAAGKFPAVFAEIFADYTVYRDNFFQGLALHRADEKGKLEEVLREREMLRGGSE